jgi:hypothetical protein
MVPTPVQTLLTTLAAAVAVLVPSQAPAQQSRVKECQETADRRITACTTGLGECTGYTGTFCSNRTTCTRPASDDCIAAYAGGTFRGFHTYYCDNLDSSNRGSDREVVLEKACGKEATSVAAPEANSSSSSGLETAAKVGVVMLGLYALDKLLQPSPAPEHAIPPPPPVSVPVISGTIFKAADFDFFSDANHDEATKAGYPRRLFVFHRPEFDPYKLGFEHVEYYHNGQLLLAHRDGRRYDIGARVTVPGLHKDIQAARYVYIIQTKDGKPVKGSEMILHIMF